MWPQRGDVRPPSAVPLPDPVFRFSVPRIPGPFGVLLAVPSPSASPTRLPHGAVACEVGGSPRPLPHVAANTGQLTSAISHGYEEKGTTSCPCERTWEPPHHSASLPVAVHTLHPRARRLIPGSVHLLTPSATRRHPPATALCPFSE